MRNTYKWFYDAPPPVVKSENLDWNVLSGSGPLSTGLAYGVNSATAKKGFIYLAVADGPAVTPVPTRRALEAREKIYRMTPSSPRYFVIIVILPHS